MNRWRVFWVPQGHDLESSRRVVLSGWKELGIREAEAGIRTGDPIFLSPDHRVDPVLGLYGRSRSFRTSRVEVGPGAGGVLQLLPVGEGERARRPDPGDDGGKPGFLRRGGDDAGTGEGRAGLERALTDAADLAAVDRRAAVAVPRE